MCPWDDISGCGHRATKHNLSWRNGITILHLRDWIFHKGNVIVFVVTRTQFSNFTLPIQYIDIRLYYADTTYFNQPKITKFIKNRIMFMWDTKIVSIFLRLLKKLGCYNCFNNYRFIMKNKNLPRVVYSATVAASIIMCFCILIYVILKRALSFILKWNKLFTI